MVVHEFLGDIGNYTDPLLYLYNKDLKHPSKELCKCGRHLITYSTSSLPIRYYYDKVCVYHTYRRIIHYKIGSQEYELDTATNKPILINKENNTIKYQLDSETNLIGNKFYRAWGELN